MDALIERERGIVRKVLSIADAGVDLGQFDRALAQYAEEEPREKLPQMRRVIYKTLIDLCGVDRPLSCAGRDRDDPGQILGGMIERSSRELNSILEPTI